MHKSQARLVPTSHYTTSAILVSYNTVELTCRAIEALQDQLDIERDEIIVVDNASSDGTIDTIHEKFPDVVAITNPTNAGFGAANNLGMAVARGEYFLLINTDAFVQTGAVHTLVDKLKANPSLGVIGPKLLNRDGSLQRSCFRFPEPKQAWREAFGLHYFFKDIERWRYDRDREVDFVSGACLMIRRSVFEQVGGFDERFFMYCEESDWQRRIRAAGWQVGFTPDCAVVHFGGGSNKAGGIHPEFFRSIDKYQLKHGGWLGLLLFRLGMITGLLIRLPYRVARLLAGDVHGFMRSLRLLARQTLNWRVTEGVGR